MEDQVKRERRSPSEPACLYRLPETYRNFLAECAYSDDFIDAKIEAAWNSIFVDPVTRFYFETPDGGAYFMDTGNDDARTEGMSYGMMMAVQMDRKDVFDRLWKWTKDHMFQRDGWHAGYFAWSCALDGTHNDEGPAPDGEEYFAMALFLAAHRWGEGVGLFAYAAEARAILRACVHKGEPGIPGDPMWDPETKLIKFVPGLAFTDPSYHLPHFYDLFAEWADHADRPFWRMAAAASREFLPKACHPKTGLAPEYSAYDGTPNHVRGHGDFFSDSYRVALNIGLDSLWTGGSSATDEIALKICSFFDKIATSDFRSYRIDGTPLSEPALHPVGLLATNAAGAIAASRVDGGKEIATRAVARFMEIPPRTGDRRYYDNCLYFFALLLLSGRYRVW